MSSEALRFLQQENTRLQAEALIHQEEIATLKRYVAMAAELYQARAQIAAASEPLLALNELLARLVAVIGSKDGSILQWDPETNELVFILVQGELQQELPGRRIPGDGGVAGWVASNRIPVIVNQPRQDWRFSFQVDEEFAFLTQSIMCLPLEAGDRLLGVMELVNKEPAKFSETDQVLTTIFADVAAMVLAAGPVQPIRPTVPDMEFF
ncbi:MAG TPA: GAF domain-containing protein [Anaerolineae bacterium]|nr:GAF domain-containing protein [Anaerolineae bacterium]